MTHRNAAHSKLGIPPEIFARCRVLAQTITTPIDAFVRERTTVAIERTLLRLIGVDGADADGRPYPNIAVEHLCAQGGLGYGILRPLVHAMVSFDLTPQEACEAIAAGEVTLDLHPTDPRDAEVQALAQRLADQALQRILQTREERARRMAAAAPMKDPLLYVIVATGNIYEDAVQARTAAIQGADVIAVIRSTGQSLLDFVPYGPTTEGFGGTYATQANFRIVREALDDVGAQLGRYIMLCNYCSGLCMPEIAAMGALERLDMMLNDALYGILFRDINPQRTLIDQSFSRRINALAGVIINTGEDNYLTTDDAVEATHTVLASQFVNEALALQAGLPPEQMGLGHAMEMDPQLRHGFLYELAQAQLVREAFPQHRLKFMPPTRHMTGNTFRGLVQDALFHLLGGWTEQGILLLGMHTEAMHTPHIADRKIALETAQMILSNTAGLGDELTFRPGGVLQSRASETMDKTLALLEETAQRGLWDMLAAGRFAAVARHPEGGRGLSGVARREATYLDTIDARLRRATGTPTTEGGAA